MGIAFSLFACRFVLDLERLQKRKIVKDLIEIFWKTQNFLVKLYVLGILGLVAFAMYIGFLFLIGDLKVEKSPEVIPSESQYECSFSERTGEYYCPDPPERWQDEFPARP
jgi:hypothetical protein